MLRRAFAGEMPLAESAKFASEIIDLSGYRSRYQV